MRDILLTSSALILALLALRRLFRKTLSRRVQYALWGLVVLRLLVPVSLPAAEFSLLTAAEPVVSDMESLYVYPERESIRGQDGAPVMGPPSAPYVAVGPAAEDPTYTFPSQDALGSPVEIEAEYQWQFHLEDLLRPLWYGGMAVMACWLVLSNLWFWRKLRKNRKPYAVEGFRLPLYLVESGLPSPCLFGLFRPAVYLTPAALASPDSLRHVLAHEETHARHWDPLWSLLRGVCLTVYWFDPLVWWAALASRTDCELACDEGALRRLGEAERVPYGQTLLSLIPVRRTPANPLLSATTMTSDKRRLMDRITRIAENRRTLGTALFAAVALAALACAVTFTGAKTADVLRPLTEEELDYFNGAFFTEAYTQGENMRRQFLTCIYERPEDIDLATLLYNGTGLPEEITEADLAFVEENYPNGVESGFVKISLTNVETFLLENTETPSENAVWSGVVIFRWNADADAFYNIYLDEEAAAYYHYTDALRSLEPVAFTYGEREGDVVRLHYQGSIFSERNGSTAFRSTQPLSSGPLCVTLREKEDGGWLFVSNQWDSVSLDSSRPDWDPLYTIPLDGLEPYEPEIAEPIRFPPGPKMLDSPEDPDHILGDYGLLFFQNGDGSEIFAGVQHKARSSWPQPFWSFRPGETGTYSASFFRNLMGHDGFCITTDDTASSHYPSQQNDYYYLNGDGQPVLLAHVEGPAEMIDLDGDGQKELVSPSRYVGSLCFRRDGKYYQANLDALLKDYWPQGTTFYYDSWDPGSRRMSFRVWIPSSASAAAAGTPERRMLYFDGENLLVYNDQRQPGDHLLEWFGVPPEVRDHALELGERVWGEAEDAYDDWRITAITGLGIHYTGGLETGVQVYEAWQVWYEFHREAEDRSEPWVSPGGPGYLYFQILEDRDGYAFLYSEPENEFPPGLSQFWAAMEDRLYRMATPVTEAGGTELFRRLCSYNQSLPLLDDVGGLPGEERDAVLNTLAAELNERGLNSWQTARHFIQNAQDRLSPRGRDAWEALQARLVTPTAPETAQAAVEALLSENRVSLTLLSPEGISRYDAAPEHLGSLFSKEQFIRDYNWSYAEDPGDMPPDSLLVIGANLSLRFWPDRDLVFLNRSGEEIWLRAVPKPAVVSIYYFMHTWYVDAKGGSLSIQAELNALLSGGAVSLTLTTEEGVQRRTADPKSGGWPGQAHAFTSGYDWSFAQDRYSRSPVTLEIASQDGQRSFTFAPYSSLVLFRRGAENFWFLVLPKDGLSGPDNAGVYSLVRAWYDGAE